MSREITGNLADTVPFANNACEVWQQSANSLHWPDRTDKSCMHPLVIDLTNFDSIKNHHNEQKRHHLGKRNTRLYWGSEFFSYTDSYSRPDLVLDFTVLESKIETPKSRSWWTMVYTKLVAQHCFQCQVFISVFKVTDDNIIITLDFVRQIVSAQANYEKHLY